MTPTDEAHDLTMRRAEDEDANALAELYSRARVAAVPMMPPALHGVEEDRAWFATQLGRRTHEAWVAERDGELVGYAMLDRVWLDHLFVRADVTGQGVGGALLDLVKTLRPDGFSLWVFESNTGARRFYARHGLIELERTDGAGNEEKAPDVRMVWPGSDPDFFFDNQLREVDRQLGDLLTRRVALMRALPHRRTVETPGEGAIDTAVEAVWARAPGLVRERVVRIAGTIVSETEAAARET